MKDICCIKEDALEFKKTVNDKLFMFDSKLIRLD